jgi:2-C-methyl-D-erythritol 4-phosphate cytidylyltransferase/2-C-methyl-D-erythritol 2,4-cyclodiphosphate synthase
MAAAATVATIVVAAGAGNRLGAGGPKAFVHLAGRPMFLHSLERLSALPGLVEQVLVVPPGRVEEARTRWTADLERYRVSHVVEGGARRQDSAAAGFRATSSAVEIVLVHDAARPLVRTEDAARVAEAAGREGAALLAIPLSDTLKREGAAGRAAGTVERDGLWRAQTPQGFRREVYAAALARAEKDGAEATDDAALVERTGVAAVLVPGHPSNLKVTTGDDLRAAEAALAAAGGGAMAGESRVGMGWDLHRLVPGRKFVLGGVAIPHPRGPLGHSDADPLLHALADAVLGAAGLGDLGEHFPPVDPQWKDADSRVLLGKAVEAARAKGLAPANADCVVVTEEPRLGPFKASIRKAVAEALGLPEEAVNIKAKSAEGLGPVGAGEAIETYAVVLMRPAKP